MTFRLANDLHRLKLHLTGLNTGLLTTEKVKNNISQVTSRQKNNKTEQAAQFQRLRKLHFSINIGDWTDIIANCNQSSELKKLNKKANLINAEQC